MNKKEQPPIVEAKYAEGMWRKSLSEIAFGRDISGLHWDELKPEEKRVVNELAQSMNWPMPTRIAPDPPAEQPMTEMVINNEHWRGLPVIPAGHQNRKARRARNASLRRAAWHVFKKASAQPDGGLVMAETIGRRNGMRG